MPDIRSCGTCLRGAALAVASSAPSKGPHLRVSVLQNPHRCPQNTSMRLHVSVTGAAAGRPKHAGPTVPNSDPCGHRAGVGRKRARGEERAVEAADVEQAALPDPPAADVREPLFLPPRMRTQALKDLQAPASLLPVPAPAQCGAAGQGARSRSGRSSTERGARGPLGGRAPAAAAAGEGGALASRASTQYKRVGEHEYPCWHAAQSGRRVCSCFCCRSRTRVQAPAPALVQSLRLAGPLLLRPNRLHHVLHIGSLVQPCSLLGLGTFEDGVSWKQGCRGGLFSC